ncbi:MAG TPA: hypothetical protein VHS31_01230 [Tepidisphaeraceae bacterium]|nr:hypothetical protein [Tepidisphaeraceae bacterium]
MLHLTMLKRWLADDSITCRRLFQSMFWVSTVIEAILEALEAF